MSKLFAVEVFHCMECPAFHKLNHRCNENIGIDAKDMDEIALNGGIHADCPLGEWGMRT